VEEIEKIFQAVLREKEVMEFFANLEREKNSLVLCIAEIDSCVLLRTYNKSQLTSLLDHCFTLSALI
jgi:hypothetical protein